MKKATFLLVLLCVVHKVADAQDFPGFLHQGRLELTTCEFDMHQEGIIYYDAAHHDPVLYYSPAVVKDKFSHIGFGLNAWYAINFGQTSYDKVGYGFETGFNLNTGSQDRSVIVPEKTKSFNIRVPVLFGLRMGSAVDPAFYGKWGIGVSGGVEIIRSSIANESGLFVLPKVQGLLTFKKFMITAGYYPIAVKSYYMVNGVRTERMKSTFFDWSFRFCLPLYSKKYRTKRASRLNQG